MTSSSMRPSAYTVIRDPATWDALVCRHAHASFMQSAAWGQFKRYLGWTPFRICLSPGASKPAVAQALFRRLPWSPFTVGYVARGPLLDYDADDALAEMVRAMDVLARRVRAVSITWELPVAHDSSLSARLQRLGLRPAGPVQHSSTRVLDISPDLEEIQRQWKPKWRSNTRLAVKHGVTVRAARDVADFARWYELLQATSVRDHFTIRPEEYYRRFWQLGCRSGSTVLLLAEHEEKLLAGFMIHRFGCETTYLYGASANEGRNLMPNNLLHWEAIQWSKKLGATRYDLFGIADTDGEQEPLAGVSRFKAGFGGEAVHYAGAYDRVYHRVLFTALQRVRAGGLA